jgi:tRNA uridine 5-carboxymethylaminomethyl modification enzyme
MFTSRAEFRLSLRQDNADRRLTARAAQAGLVGADRAQRVAAKEQAIAAAVAMLETTRHGEATLAKWLRQTETTWEDIVAAAPPFAELPPHTARQVLYDVKYAGYVARQAIDVERQRRLAAKRIPSSFDYARIRQLRTEAREKLLRVRPVSLAQASRISGITPADIALVMAHLEHGLPTGA